VQCAFPACDAAVLARWCAHRRRPVFLVRKTVVLGQRIRGPQNIVPIPERLFFLFLRCVGLLCITLISAAQLPLTCVGAGEVARKNSLSRFTFLGQGGACVGSSSPVVLLVHNKVSRCICSPSFGGCVCVCVCVCVWHQVGRAERRSGAVMLSSGAVMLSSGAVRPVRGAGEQGSRGAGGLVEQGGLADQ
jgi:hypothetical protein